MAPNRTLDITPNAERTTPPSFAMGELGLPAGGPRPCKLGKNMPPLANESQIPFRPPKPASRTVQDLHAPVLLPRNRFSGELRRHSPRDPLLVARQLGWYFVGWYPFQVGLKEHLLGFPYSTCPHDLGFSAEDEGLSPKTRVRVKIGRNHNKDTPQWCPHLANPGPHITESL